MARLDPQALAAKWSQRAGAAQGDYVDGVRRTTADPGAAAAAAADKWQVNTQAAKDKFRAGVGRVSKGEWQAAVETKGATRYSSGVQAAQGKMAAFASEFLPHLDQVTQRTRAMPSTTLEQRLERMRQQAIGVSQFRRGRGGSYGGA